MTKVVCLVPHKPPLMSKRERGEREKSNPNQNKIHVGINFEKFKFEQNAEKD